MNRANTGQISTDAAEIYDRWFLPALFEQWPQRLLERSGVRPGQRILDVACGTGAFARAAAPYVGSSGTVVGVDINEGMLAVARRRSPDIDWRQAPAEALPFAEHSFDHVFCQFGLMFFADRELAVREMLRVLRPSGKLAALVWSSLAESPGYACLVELLARLFGSELASAMAAPYCLADSGQLRDLFASAGASDVTVETWPGSCHFPSLEAWIKINIQGWTLAELLDSEQLRRLEREAAPTFSRFVGPDGAIVFDAPARWVLAKPHA